MTLDRLHQETVARTHYERRLTVLRASVARVLQAIDAGADPHATIEAERHILELPDVEVPKAKRRGCTCTSRRRGPCYPHDLGVKAPQRPTRATVLRATTPPNRRLTRRQRAILRWIRDYIAEHGRSPTQNEIGAAHDINQGTVYRHLEAMNRKGFLMWGGGRRSIELSAAAQTA